MSSELRKRAVGKPADEVTTSPAVHENAKNNASISIQKASTWPTSLASFCISFLIYFLTLHPSVPAGDSGELIAAAHELAVPHPPGYPTFALLSYSAIKLLNWTPLSPAARVNFMNAILSSTSIAVLCATISLLTRRPWISLLCSLSFALSPIVWTYSISAEVFSLNNLFTSVLCYICLLFSTSTASASSSGYRTQWRLAILGSFVSGLGLSNQHTISLFVIPFAVYFGWSLLIQPVWTSSPSNPLSQVKNLFFVFLALLLGLSPYSYLYFSAQMNPNSELSWGTDTSTLSGFIHHLLRKDYGTFSLAASDAPYKPDLYVSTLKYITSIVHEFTPIGAIFASLGLVASLASPLTRSKQQLMPSIAPFLWTICLFFYIIFFHSLGNMPLHDPLLFGVFQRFWMQPNILIVLLASYGLHLVASLFEAMFIRMPKIRSITTSIGYFAAAVFVTFLCATRWHAQDESSNFYTHSFGKELLQNLPNNAILLTLGDDFVNPARYIQKCEGFRPDVTIIDQEMLVSPIYTSRWKARNTSVIFPGTHYSMVEPGSFNMKKFVKANSKRPIFFAAEVKRGDTSVHSDYFLQQWGLAQRLVSRKSAFKTGIESYVKKSAALLPNLFEMQLNASSASSTLLLLPPMNKYGPETWERRIALNYIEAHARRAYHMIVYSLDPEVASRSTDKQDVLDSALRESARILEAVIPLHQALTADGKSAPSHLYKNLGVAYNSLISRSRSSLEEVWHVVESTIKWFSLYLESEESKDDSQTPHIIAGIEQMQSYLASLPPRPL